MKERLLFSAIVLLASPLAGAGTSFWSMLPLRDLVDAQGPYKLSDPVEVMMSDTVRVFRALPDYIIGPRSCTLQFEVR